MQCLADHLTSMHISRARQLLQPWEFQHIENRNTDWIGWGKFTSRGLNVLTMNYIVIPREGSSAERKKKGHSWYDALPRLAPRLAGRVVYICSGGPSWNFPCASSLPSGKLEGWRVLYPQKHIPVASILGIFVSLSHRNWPFPESFANTESTLKSCKTIPLLFVCLNMGESPLIWNSCVMPAI